MAQKKQKEQITITITLGKFTKDDDLFHIMDDWFRGTISFLQVGPVYCSFFVPFLP